eukprot:TRINITY_DN37392_c0_g1_i1.p2 TRINITY_DN37392_c0_g1~~TRINITY_DN37392_c0_g1_i1.p2  ORF type:complete len:209 (-),score=82.00 TRINITY_DN37392_c0_g1_i1:215-841(-)
MTQKGSFTTNFSAMGQTRQSQLFSGAPGGGSIIDQEKELIEKVFRIVDVDSSGQIDMQELGDMFKLFGIESHHLTSTISRVMSNVDKDFDNQISAQEFYDLLSAKFEKGDPRKEIDNVFHKMDKKKDGQLDVDEMFEVSQVLGEGIDKKEIRDMIKMFNQGYQKELQAWDAKKGAAKGEPPAEPTSISMDDFYAIMQVELAAPKQDLA